MPNPFNPQEYPQPTVYFRNGKSVFLDPCRRMLIPVTPEEEIRQKFIAYLECELGVPVHCIWTEVNLNRFQRGARGRLDLMVASSDGSPILVAECKAPNIPLGDIALEQVMNYHSVATPKADVVVITNGTDTRWYRVGGSTTPEILMNAPTYEDLVEGKIPQALEPVETMPRPSPTFLTQTDCQWFLDDGSLGPGSPGSNHPYLLNLIGLFRLEPKEPEYRGRRGRFSIESTGLRETYFGNAGGGKWDGLYRYFVIQDGLGNTQIVSITIRGMMLAKNHPRFGNTNGHTMLIVAVDNYERSHNSLQLDLDKFVVCSHDIMRIWHDGTLTRGNRGSAKRGDVLSFINARAPHLMQANKIVLGTLPRNRLVTWKDAEEFIYNCIEYALVRDQFRTEAG